MDVKYLGLYKKNGAAITPVLNSVNEVKNLFKNYNSSFFRNFDFDSDIDIVPVYINNNNLDLNINNNSKFKTDKIYNLLIEVKKLNNYRLKHSENSINIIRQEEVDNRLLPFSFNKKIIDEDTIHIYLNNFNFYFLDKIEDDLFNRTFDSLKYLERSNNNYNLYLISSNNDFFFLFEFELFENESLYKNSIKLNLNHSYISNKSYLYLNTIKENLNLFFSFFANDYIFELKKEGILISKTINSDLCDQVHIKVKAADYSFPEYEFLYDQASKFNLNKLLKQINLFKSKFDNYDYDDYTYKEVLTDIFNFNYTIVNKKTLNYFNNSINDELYLMLSDTLDSNLNKENTDILGEISWFTHLKDIDKDSKELEYLNSIINKSFQLFNIENIDFDEFDIYTISTFPHLSLSLRENDKLYLIYSVLNDNFKHFDLHFNRKNGSLKEINESGTSELYKNKVVATEIENKEVFIPIDLLKYLKESNNISYHNTYNLDVVKKYSISKLDGTSRIGEGFNTFFYKRPSRELLSFKSNLLFINNKNNNNDKNQLDLKTNGDGFAITLNSNISFNKLENNILDNKFKSKSEFKRYLTYTRSIILNEGFLNLEIHEIILDDLKKDFKNLEYLLEENYEIDEINKKVLSSKSFSSSTHIPFWYKGITTSDKTYYSAFPFLLKYSYRSEEKFIKYLLNFFEFTLILFKLNEYFIDNKDELFKEIISKLCLINNEVNYELFKDIRRTYHIAGDLIISGIYRTLYSIVQIFEINNEFNLFDNNELKEQIIKTINSDIKNIDSSDTTESSNYIKEPYEWKEIKENLIEPVISDKKDIIESDKSEDTTFAPSGFITDVAGISTTTVNTD